MPKIKKFNPYTKKPKPMIFTENPGEDFLMKKLGKKKKKKKGK